MINQQPQCVFNSPIGYHPNQLQPAGYDYPTNQQHPAGNYYSPQQCRQEVLLQPPGQQPQQQQQFYRQSEHQSGLFPGLERLRGTDRIVIRQKKEMLEIFAGWETNNRYEIFDSIGQQIFYAVEDTSGFDRCCYGKERPFCIQVLDKNGQQVMVINSSVNCCTREVTVEVPPGRLAAQIKQEFAFMAPSFYINNPGGDLMFKVKSPMTAALGSFGNTNFDILSSDQETIVGQITRQWGGFFKEAFTDADTFGLSLPANMDVNWKAVLLAVTFVVDFEFYEL